MWRVRIRHWFAALLVALVIAPPAIAAGPYAYKLKITPEEGPVDLAVEGRKSLEYGTCAQGAMTTLDSTDCLMDELQRQDTMLNLVWGHKYRHIAPANKPALLAAQRKWVAARDPFCRKQSDAYKGGTIAPIIFVACKMDLTIRRTMWLEKLK